jgi:hypothetical protein
LCDRCHRVSRRVPRRAFAAFFDSDPATEEIEVVIAVYDRDLDGNGLMGNRDLVCAGPIPDDCPQPGIPDGEPDEPTDTRRGAREPEPPRARHAAGGDDERTSENLR